MRIATMILIVAAAGGQTLTPPEGIRLSTWVREDIFAGFLVNDMARFEQGERKIEVVLKQNPHSGHVFVFRGRRGDLIKLLWWDGDGLCLFAKRLERGRFIWPKLDSGAVALTGAQLSMLLEAQASRQQVQPS